MKGQVQITQYEEQAAEETGFDIALIPEARAMIRQKARQMRLPVQYYALLDDGAWDASELLLRRFLVVRLLLQYEAENGFISNKKGRIQSLRRLKDHLEEEAAASHEDPLAFLNRGPKQPQSEAPPAN